MKLSTFGMWVVLALSVSGQGCLTPQLAWKGPSWAHPVERLELVYKTHLPDGAVFTAPAATPIQQTAAVGGSAEPWQDLRGGQWAMAELTIQFPHPDNRPDMALASLHFEPVACGHTCERVPLPAASRERREMRKVRRSARLHRLWNVAVDEEPTPFVARLDIPKCDLDALLAQLEAAGYFRERGRPEAGPAELIVMKNRSKTARPWKNEPALDELLSRVWASAPTVVPASAVAAVPGGGLSPAPGLPEATRNPIQLAVEEVAAPR